MRRRICRNGHLEHWGLCPRGGYVFVDGNDGHAALTTRWAYGGGGGGGDHDDDISNMGCAAGFLCRLRDRDDVAACVPGRLGLVCVCFWTVRLHDRALIVIIRMIIRMASFPRTHDGVVHGGRYGRCTHRKTVLCVYV